MNPSPDMPSHPGKPKLRIGVLLDSTTVPQWMAEILRQLAECDFASIELLVYNGAASKAAALSATPRSLFRKLLSALADGKRRRGILFAIYQRLDARSVEPAANPQSPVDCAELFARWESMTVDPLTSRFVHRFPEEAVQRIRETNLDVIIRFGFNILRGEILAAARFGVWSYHHGDSERYRGGPACFWEIVERNPMSGVILQVLTEELDGGMVLCKGLYATTDGISLSRNRLQPYWGAAPFLVRKLRELHVRGWEHVSASGLAPASYHGRKKIYTSPSNAEMLRWLAPVFLKKAARRLFRRATIRHWRLAFRDGGVPITEPAGASSLSGFRWIDSPKGHFYADPFVVEAEGVVWIFFEDFDYATQLGRICCAPVRDGALGEPIVVLERPYHLSYPCVFREAGAWYMIPESIAAGTVELFRCERFPDRWVPERLLFEGPAVDATVWIEAGTCWYFVTHVEPRSGAMHLSLYFADTIAGAWTPHPCSPISTDVRYARGAGAIFRRGGKLFRPSQDCSGEYGRCIVFNEIVVLDRDEYREVPRRVVEPDWDRDLLGTHSYGACGGLEVVDGKVRIAPRHVL